jgi:hypothetical protein
MIFLEEVTMSKLNFENMNRDELARYMVAHRDTPDGIEARRAYIRQMAEKAKSQGIDLYQIQSPSVNTEMKNYTMRGVQFLTDYQGNKTAAIVDLKEHSQFWADVLEECGEPTDFQFLINDKGENIAVLLEFDKHGELWEDVYDGITCDECENGPGVPLEEFERELMSKGMLNV